MRTRFFRVISTGEWLDTTISTEGEFSVPEDSHKESISDAIGEPVEVVEVEGGDPRVGIIRQLPPAPVILSPRESRKADLTGRATRATTVAQLREVVLDLIEDD